MVIKDGSLLVVHERRGPVGGPRYYRRAAVHTALMRLPHEGEHAGRGWLCSDGSLEEYLAAERVSGASCERRAGLLPEVIDQGSSEVRGVHAQGELWFGVVF